MSYEWRILDNKSLESDFAIDLTNGNKITQPAYEGDDSHYNW